MCQHRAIAPLLARVVEAVVGGIPADRASILFRRGPEETLALAATQARPGRDSGAPLSTTLIGHVLQTRASVLTTDAAQDDRFESSESIAQHQIKAVICAPLTGPEGVYGVLYVESDAVPVPLTQHHLQLLSVAGQITGAGVENILLVERQIRQERLAGIGETVSGTSHDMRNIMMGISGGAAFIEMACDQGNWDQARNGVSIVRKSLARFDNLVNSLLTYARQTELELEEADLGALINEAATAARMEAEKRGLRIVVENRAPGCINMDPLQIYRVVMNLLANAMDATEGPGGEITLETGRDGGVAFFRVCDTGCGIAPEDIDRIGQPFFTTKHQTGTGLGLAVSYRIVEQHRGRVLVDSMPGRGTVFTVLFPPDQATTQHDNVSA
jgi:signal transduction histidine kinase